MEFKATAFRKCKPYTTCSVLCNFRNRGRKVDYNSEDQNRPHSVSSHTDILVMGSSFVIEPSADTYCFFLAHISWLNKWMVVCFVFLCEPGTNAIWIKLRAFSYGQNSCYFILHCNLGFSTLESCTQKKPSGDWLVTAVLQEESNATFYVDRKMEMFI